MADRDLKIQALRDQMERQSRILSGIYNMKSQQPILDNISNWWKEIHSLLQAPASGNQQNQLPPVPPPSNKVRITWIVAKGLLVPCLQSLKIW